VAASTFEPNEGLDEELVVFVLDDDEEVGDCGGLQNIWPPWDNSILLPFLAQTGWPLLFEANVDCAVA
jgi:hypothetical protein